MSRLVALPGGGGMPGQLRPTVEITARRRAQSAGHPSVPFYDRATAEPEADPCAPTLALHLSPLDASLLERACRLAYEREPSLAWVELADLVRDQRYGGTFVEPDPCNATGLPRPGGVA